MSILVEELKKLQPPKMTFRSQIEPPIKTYECFMFLQKFQIGNHNGLMDSWKTLIVFFSNTDEEKKCTQLPKNKTRKLFGDLEVGVLFRVILNLARPSGWFYFCHQKLNFVQKGQKSETSKNGPQKSNRSLY